ncbi:MAG: hypothetical protein AAB521_02425 [Patescibacteria group bacterium]
MDTIGNKQTILIPKTNIPTLKIDFNLFLQILNNLVQNVKNTINSLINRSSLTNPSYPNRNFRNRNTSRFLFLIIAVVLLTLSFYLGKSLNQNSTSYKDDRPPQAATKARQILNKEFEFPLKDDKGKDISKVKYKIESAELQDSIIVKGQRATAVKGRTFLILNLKVSNNFTQGIEINSRDYVRLQIDSSKELIAADVHNDPVAVQAISTKFTRLGFPINDSDKNLMLTIGEIKGKKESIKIIF